MIKKLLKKIGFVIIAFIIVLSVLLSAAIVTTFRIWPSITMQEIVYHLQAPLQGTETGILLRFGLGCVTPFVMMIVLMVFLHRRKMWKVLPAIMAISLCVGVSSSVYAWNRLDVKEYLKNQSSYSGFIDEHYIYPSEVSITFPKKKRNLIYIYLESMENTFADVESGGAFSENLIPNLTKLSLENENFSGDSTQLNGAFVMNNTTWTMGAMFAQSTGLPLILPIDGNAMYSQDAFFPELIGIGDILKEAGYKNMLLMGSHAMFGGREIFYQDHGAYRMLDYDYSIVYEEIPKDYYVWWGYEDAKLFEFAKKHLIKAAKGDEPFNLTMLTVDTHYEDGYLCEDCQRIHENNPYADVYNCSDRKVGEFIQWVQRQAFYENTTIILVGDHLTMDKDFCKNVSSEYERKVYVSIINSAIASEDNNQLSVKQQELAAQAEGLYQYQHLKGADVNREEKEAADNVYQKNLSGQSKKSGYRYYSTMDMFPTTLAALGAKIEGERLGLGTNLYSEYPTLLELYGKDEMNAKMEQRSILMESLARTVDESRLDENWSALSKKK